MRTWLWILLVISSLLSSQQAIAKIYKCTTPSGKVNFKDTPCKSGQSEEISITKTNVMDKNSQAERYKSSVKPNTTKKNQRQLSPAQDPLKRNNQMMCEMAKKAYDQQVKEIKARCKKGRETFCSLPAEDIQKRWDDNYLKRESGDAFSPPSRQWHAFNRNGAAPIYNLKSQVNQYCGS